MASLRISTAVRHFARQSHVSRNYTVALNTPVLSRRVVPKPSTPSSAKANASTTAGVETKTLENASAPTTNGTPPNEDTAAVVNNFGNGNGDGIGELQNDWSKSYHGLSSAPFPKDIADLLQAPLDPLDIEMKPDGLIYLPEIKYRRILNKAFGPGAWGLAPRGETRVDPKIVSREYALVCQGRLVAIARGEQEYFDSTGISTATEGCKSNALMRCCKDLGIASELWDPRFIREFKAKYCMEVFVEHLPTKKKKKLWRRKDQPKFGYPHQE